MDTTPKSRKNKHLNAFECYKLESLLKAKVSVLKTAKILCRAKSTIYQEINQGIVKFRKSDYSVRKEYSAYYSLNIRQDSMGKTGRKL